ncbi:hypothetical protein [Allosphingosinicella humi]
MSDETSPFRVPPTGEAGRQIAQFRNALMLVEQIAGRGEVSEEGDPLLAECARIDTAYRGAPPVVQRRFDAMVSEIALWTAVGVEALITARDGGTPSSNAAARLADELRRALRQLSRVLGEESIAREDTGPVLADQP